MQTGLLPVFAKSSLDQMLHCQSAQGRPAPPEWPLADWAEHPAAREVVAIACLGKYFKVTISKRREILRKELHKLQQHRIVIVNFVTGNRPTRLSHSQFLRVYGMHVALQYLRGTYLEDS